LSNSVIGALRVSLGLDSAQFHAGVNRAQSSFGGMAASFAKGALGAAAGFLTIQAAIDGTRAALEKFGRVADQSKAAGLDPEFFQGLGAQARLAGVDINGLAGALNTFAAQSGLAAEGKGRLVSQLKVLNPELLTAIQNATNQADRIRAVADAIAAETDASRKAAIARAAFGSEGVKLVAVLEQGADKIDAMIAKAKEMGLVVSREMIEKADELGDRFDLASEIVDNKLKEAFIRLAPLLVWAAEQAARFANDLANAAEQMDDISKGDFSNAFFTAADRLKMTQRDLVNERGRFEAGQGPIMGDARDAPLDGVGGAFPNFGDIEDLFGGTSSSALPSLASPSVDPGDLEEVAEKIDKVSGAFENNKSVMGEWAEQFNVQIDRAAEEAEEAAERVRQAWEGSAQLVSGALDALAGAIGSSSEESFETSKKLRMASAIVAGISAVQNAFEKGNEIGGPILGAVWAGLAGVTAAANVAAIGATTFNSTSMAGAATSGSAPAAASGVSQGGGLNLTLVGETFSRSSVESTFAEIQEWLGTQGKTLNVSYKGA
jgi:lysophospholipase L1-like esterase